MRLYLWVTLIAAVFAAVSSPAAIHYVAANGTNPVSPYTNWVMAATNIQDAVDAASAGEQILVTNGVYAVGGRNWFGSGTNRVTLTNSVTLSSVNGPAVTLIVGGRAVGAALMTATRCVGMGSNAVLSGFTLTNGEAGGGNYPAGGGVAGITSGNGTVTNCVLINNLATNNLGGGANRATLINCKLIGNAAGNGGGASACTLVNCLVVSNTATASGGGVYGDHTTGVSSLTNCTIVGNAATSIGGGVDNEGNGALNNCLVYYNTAPSGSNYANIKLNVCCTQPTLTGDLGSFTNAPLFVNMAGGDFHLLPWSPCLNAGNNAYVANAADLDGNPRIIAGTVDIGAYEFQSPVHFVNLGNTAPVSPFTNWLTAATNIQDAVDAATNGDLVLVTNGVYATGGRMVNGVLTNRVVINKAVAVQSVNGPAATLIQGYQVPGTINGNNAVRCVYLTNNAVLTGFTLTNGATYPFNAAGAPPQVLGGGVFCNDLTAMVSNCVLVGNAAGDSGGGAAGGTINKCTITANSSAYGGGAYQSTLNGCLVVSNYASAAGGGIYDCKINNSLILGNSAVSAGGGAFNNYLSVLNNCSLVGNAATLGGGAVNGNLNNCIVYYNAGGNYATDYQAINLTDCCTTPMPGGSGNITNEPLFVNVTNNFHLQSNSPCINSGNNAYANSATDLDGNARIAGGTVDLGAYEYQTPTSAISYAWLQQYGLPTDGSADYVDADGDGMNNWQEWIAGTNPTDATSVLKVLAPPATNNASGLTITWPSVPGKNYSVQRTSNLGAPSSFATIGSGISGQSGTTSYTDTTATNPIPYFFRIGVQ